MEIVENENKKETYKLSALKEYINTKLIDNSNWKLAIIFTNGNKKQYRGKSSYPYNFEAFESLNMWDEVLEKASLGTNVTEVLTWVAEGSADAGVVYSTDAASNDKVEVRAEAPKDSVSKVIYPIGVIKNSEKVTQAKAVTEFLKSEEAMKIFESYGFIESK